MLLLQLSCCSSSSLTDASTQYACWLHHTSLRKGCKPFVSAYSTKATERPPLWMLSLLSILAYVTRTVGGSIAGVGSSCKAYEKPATSLCPSLNETTPTSALNGRHTSRDRAWLIHFQLLGASAAVCKGLKRRAPWVPTRFPPGGPFCSCKDSLPPLSICRFNCKKRQHAASWHLGTKVAAFSVPCYSRTSLILLSSCCTEGPPSLLLGSNSNQAKWRKCPIHLLACSKCCFSSSSSYSMHSQADMAGTNRYPSNPVSPAMSIQFIA